MLHLTLLISITVTIYGTDRSYSFHIKSPNTPPSLCFQVSERKPIPIQTINTKLFNFHGACASCLNYSSCNGSYHVT